MKKLTVGLILVLVVTAIVGCSPADLHGDNGGHVNEGPTPIKVRARILNQ